MNLCAICQRTLTGLGLCNGCLKLPLDLEADPPSGCSCMRLEMVVIEPDSRQHTGRMDVYREL